MFTIFFDYMNIFSFHSFLQGHLYSIALNSQWDSGRWFEISGASVRVSPDRRSLVGVVYFGKGPHVSRVGVQLLQAGDDLYDVYLLVDGVGRSENRRTLDVAPDEVDEDMAGGGLSEFDSLLDAVGGFSPISERHKTVFLHFLLSSHFKNTFNFPKLFSLFFFFLSEKTYNVFLDFKLSLHFKKKSFL